MPRSGAKKLAPVFLLATLWACGRGTPPQEVTSRATAERARPCATSPVRKLLAEGQLQKARAQVKTASSATDLACATDEERSQLEEEITWALGECGPSGAGPDCIPNENLSPKEAVRQAQALFKSENDAAAHRVLDRARYAAERRKERVEVVPAWLSRVQHITFVEPDRFVIGYEGGTSLFEGDDFRERTRCAAETHPTLLSPLRRFASLWKEEGLIELSTCKKHTLGKVVAYSSSEDLVLVKRGEFLRVWDSRSEKVLWEKAFPVGETNKEVKGGCFSPDNSQVVVALGFGGVQVHAMQPRVLVWETEVPPDRGIVNHLRVPIDPIDRSCDFSEDGSLLTIRGKSQGMLRLYESILGFEPTTGQLLFNSHPFDSSGAHAAPSLQERADPEDEVAIQMDENRYTVSLPGSESKKVLHLTKDRSSQIHGGRFLRYGDNLVHLPSERRLSSQGGASSSPLVWHQDALCILHRCFFAHNQFLYRRDAADSEAMQSVEDLYGRSHIARGLRLSPWEVTDVVHPSPRPWQWPKDVLADAPRGEPKVAQAAFDDSGDTAWLLTEKGQLLAFSTDSGRLAARVPLDSSDECRANAQRGGSAAMTGSARAGLLLVRPPGGTPCSLLVDTKSHTAKSTPIELPRSFQLSEDGSRVAVEEEREIAIYSLQTFKENARFPSKGSQFALSHSGDKIVELSPGYYEEAPGGYMRDVPARIHWSSLGGTDLVPPLEFPDDTLDSTDPTLEASPRLIAFENRLYDYSGQKVAEVFTRGGAALVSYETGEAEIFGSSSEPVYRCLVGGQVVPELFCASLLVEGKLGELLGGLPEDKSESSSAADVPLPAHCSEPVTPCGEPLPLDSPFLECGEKPHFDPHQARCLRHVRSMNLAGESFSGLAADQSVSELERLTIRSPKFSDLASFRNARKLQILRAEGVPIRDLSPLEDLKHLRELHLKNTAVSDLSPLAGLIHLEELDLSGTNVRDLSALSTLVNLKELRLRQTQVEDLTPLLSLPRLKELDLSDTKVTEVPSLQSLVALQELNLYGVSLANWSFVETSPNLRSIGVTPSLLSPAPMRAVRSRFPHIGIQSPQGQLLVQ